MAENHPNPELIEPGTVPEQPEAQATKRFNLKVVGGIAAVILVIGLANLRNGTKQVPIANSAVMKPASPQRYPGKQLRGAATDAPAA